MAESFTAWQAIVLEMLPGEMIYQVELKPLWKEGMSPDHAVRVARNRKLIHKRGSSEAPLVQANRGGRPRMVGVKRKPHWELAYIQAKVKAAIFSIMVEAETHRLEPDAVDYVRQTKRKLCE